MSTKTSNTYTYIIYVGLINKASKTNTKTRLRMRWKLTIYIGTAYDMIEKHGILRKIHVKPSHRETIANMRTYQIYNPCVSQYRQLRTFIAKPKQREKNVRMVVALNIKYRFGLKH